MPTADPLGAFRDAQKSLLTALSTQSIRLSAGDKVVLFTDGFTDMVHASSKDRFTYEQFYNWLKNTRHLNKQAFIDALVAACQQYQGLEQADDMALLLIEPA